MVCERDPASPNDPAEGRIALVRDGDWLTADGTTLGADDGVAIAAMMALVEDESIPHGPLELLMTVAEEVGLEGANALDGVAAHGLDPDQPRQRGGRRPHRRLCRQHRHVDPRRRAARGVLAGCGHAVASTAGGGLGGHSGVQIALGRANAIKVLGRGAARGVRGRAVPARLARRRQEPQRDPARRESRSARCPRDQEAAFRAAVESATRPSCGRLREDRPGRDRDRRERRRRRGRLDGGGDGARCSTSSRSCRPGRSR